MSEYIILTYDLIKSGQRYDAIRKIANTIGDFRKPTESTYVFKTGLKPFEVSELFRSAFDGNDEFFVASIKSDATGTVGPDDFWEWFKP